MRDVGVSYHKGRTLLGSIYRAIGSLGGSDVIPI
jgi:hypothetical protein